MAVIMRTSGILMPVFSLPSKYGIGTLGSEAFGFVDFLVKSGQSYWQILPVGTTSYGDSPYQSFSSYAGNPYFIDLETLASEGLLETSEIEEYDWGESPEKIDYGIMYENRYKVLKKAYFRFRKNQPEDFEAFKRENAYWLDSYALFAAIKDSYSGAPFSEWDEGLKFRRAGAIKNAEMELAEDIGFYKALQYFFSVQWKKLKAYANKNGIKIIGDIPIYAALDSADVWSQPGQFQLDSDLAPVAVAGCPPDAFSEDGQLWGNPLYDWEHMKKDGWRWWTERIGFAVKLYDEVRIDHFRGFSAYFSIPYGKKPADGEWKKGPGKEFFDGLNGSLGRLNIIAEDLGTIDDDVRELLDYTGYPGMRVLQFAFDPETESTYLPHNIPKDCIVYTGTHDNDTAVGFYKEQSADAVKFMRDYLRISEGDSFNWSLIKAAMATPADRVILQMQDFLGLDNTARINTPSTVGGNWQWRITPGCINDWLAKIIRESTKLYFRLPKKPLNPQSAEKDEASA